MSKINRIKDLVYGLEQIIKDENIHKATKVNDSKDPKVLTGNLFSKFNNARTDIKSINDVEFQVFSQWGDDGIIQYLINQIDIPYKTFVEFGVENYKESNTRFLLINDNWQGLIMDGSSKNIEYVKKDLISWAYELHAKSAFITKENINELLSNLPFNKELGILHIDIDGNDYWIWDEINVVNPIIVIVEYNAVFGSKNPWTVPYKSDFIRQNLHPSYLYFGCSTSALCHIADKKGYSFIGCNKNGNNAYFIRNDKMSDLKYIKKVSSEEGYIESRFREYVDPIKGRVSGKDRLEIIKGMEVFNVITNQIEII